MTGLTSWHFIFVRRFSIFGAHMLTWACAVAFDDFFVFLIAIFYCAAAVALVTFRQVRLRILGRCGFYVRIRQSMWVYWVSKSLHTRVSDHIILRGAANIFTVQLFLFFSFELAVLLAVYDIEKHHVWVCHRGLNLLLDLENQLWNGESAEFFGNCHLQVMLFVMFLVLLFLESAPVKHVVRHNVALEQNFDQQVPEIAVIRLFVKFEPVSCVSIWQKKL